MLTIMVGDKTTNKLERIESGLTKVPDGACLGPKTLTTNKSLIVPSQGEN